MAAKGLAIVLCFVAALLAVDAQSGGRASNFHPLTAMPAPLEGIKVTSIFPDRTGQQFPAGDVIEVLVGVRNENSKPINVSFIMGSINAPQDFSLHVQNFTGMRYNTPVPPQKEASFLYMFRPDPSLPPRDFQLALTMFYANLDTQAYHASTFYNSTVEVTEPDRLVDVDALFLYLIFAAALAGLGFFAYVRLSGTKMLPGQKPKPVSQGSNREEWLKGTHFEQEQRRKSRQLSKKASTPAPKTE